jgi:F-type H+-transporting ATPase subunit delta
MSQHFTDQVITPGGIAPEELLRVQKFYETIQATTAAGSSLGRIPRTYAESLLAVADERKCVDKIADDFHAMRYDVFPALPSLEAYLVSPAINRKHRDAFILELLDGKADPLFIDFLRLLNRKDRLGLLRLIGVAFRSLLEERANRQRVLIETASDLNDTQKQSLMDTVGPVLGRTPVLVIRVNPELIGGLIVHAGDRVFDTSVRTQLKTLKNQLLARGSNEIQSRRDRFSSP